MLKWKFNLKYIHGIINILEEVHYIHKYIRIRNKKGNKLQYGQDFKKWKKCYIQSYANKLKNPGIENDFLKKL